MMMYYKEVNNKALLTFTFYDAVSANYAITVSLLLTTHNSQIIEKINHFVIFE